MHRFELNLLINLRKFKAPSSKMPEANSKNSRYWMLDVGFGILNILFSDNKLLKSEHPETSIQYPINYDISPISIFPCN